MYLFPPDMVLKGEMVRGPVYLRTALCHMVSSSFLGKNVDQRGGEGVKKGTLELISGARVCMEKWFCLGNLVGIAPRVLQPRWGRPLRLCGIAYWSWWRWRGTRRGRETKSQRPPTCHWSYCEFRTQRLLAFRLRDLPDKVSYSGSNFKEIQGRDVM